MKPKVLFLLAILIVRLLGLTTNSIHAQITLSPVAEAMVRDGSNAAVDMNEEGLGYLMVKYSTAGSSGKSYYRFDLKGQKPNINGSLIFTFSTYNNSQRQHVQLWSLNQPYADFTNSVMVWNTAQANETSSNSLITNAAAPYSATPIVDFISPTGSGTIKQVTIPAPWGQLIQNQEITIVLTSLNDPDMNQSNGLRIQTNSVSLTFEALVGGAPAISAVNDLSVTAGKVSVTNSFTLSDPDSSLASLSISATSSDETILPAGNIVIEGTGAQRTVHVTAGEVVGNVTVTLIVTDENNNTAQRAFKVNITPLDYAPSLILPPLVYTVLDKEAQLSFTVTDKETPSDRITVDGQIQAYSSEILTSVKVSGSGSNRMVTVTPASGTNGVGVVTLTAMDESNNQTVVSFSVMVLPSTATVFSDHFQYPDEEMFTSSAGVWFRRGGSQTVKLKSSNQQAWIRSSTTAEDGIAMLAYGPYQPGDRVILYTLFNATWSDITPIGTSVGSFVHLSDSNNINLVAGIATVTNDVPGQFRLRIANGATYSELSKDLQVNTAYRVAARYDVDAAQSTLWIDAASETAVGISALDTQVPVPISHVGLRQDRYMGDIYIDDLQVIAVKRPLIISVRYDNRQLLIDFRAGANDPTSSFEITGTSDFASPFVMKNASIVSLGDSTYRATLLPDGSKGFLRVNRLPMSFGR